LPLSNASLAQILAPIVPPMLVVVARQLPITAILLKRDHPVLRSGLCLPLLPPAWRQGQTQRKVT